MTIDLEPSSSSTSSYSSLSSNSTSSSSSYPLSFSDQSSSEDIQEYGYFDHLGKNWIPDDNEIVYGYHYNINNFYIKENRTINVKGYDGNPVHGMVAISANNIYVQGIINAQNKGYGGGGGGGGGWGIDSRLLSIGGSGGKGGGPSGGAGGVANDNIKVGGNAKPNIDLTVDLSIDYGSGGGGGGGGETGGGGGGGGSAGGGKIMLIATSTIDINLTGQVLSNVTPNGGNPPQDSQAGGAGGGAVGSGGQKGQDSFVAVGGAAGGGNGIGSPANAFTRGGVGGGGAGGSILIYCNTLYHAGTINVNGQATDNGGTIKIFAPNKTLNGTFNYAGGRLFTETKGIHWGNPTSTTDVAVLPWKNWVLKGTSTPVIINSDYGELKLENDQEAVSDVYDLFYVKNRSINISSNVKRGAIETLQVRGQNTSFNKSAASPSWENYTANMIRDWRYVQIKIKA